MSDLPDNSFRALNNPDIAILLKEPHLSPESATFTKLVWNYAVEPDLNFCEGGWAFFKAHVSHTWKTEGRLGSLNPIAQTLGKSRKTIVRYCEAGLIPGAYQTSGGHWRIRYGRINRAKYHRMLSRMQKFSRRRKAIRDGIASYKNTVESTNSRVWKGYAGALASGKYANETFFPEEVSSSAAKSVVGIDEEPLPDHWLKAVSGPHEQRTLLLVAVLRAHRKHSRPTVEHVAEEIGISRATLYRRYRNQISAAMAAVSKSADQPENFDSHPHNDVTLARKRKTLNRD